MDTYGSQQRNLKRTAAVARRSGSLSGLKQNVYHDWKTSTLGDMEANMPRAYKDRAKSLAHAMFPKPVPFDIVPGGPRETNYDSATGRVRIGQQLLPSIPLAAYVHEQTHAMQRGPGSQWYDTNFTEADRTSANEIAPTLAGNLAEYEARRQSGGKPLTDPTPLTQEYRPSLEWMRNQAAKYGVFSGKPIEQLLAENPQYVRLLAQQSGEGPVYESGSLSPQTADSFNALGNAMPTQKKKPFWMGSMELLAASQGSPASANAPNRSPEEARALSQAIRGQTRVQNKANVALGNQLQAAGLPNARWPRSPTAEDPATPDEIERAFNAPINYAPGGTTAQAAAAQRRLGVQPQAAAGGLSRAMSRQEVDAIQRLMDTTKLSNPQPSSAPVATTGPGKYFTGRSGPGGNRAPNQVLGSSVVGRGVQSTGMATGGAFGSALMLGRLPEPSAAKPPRPAGPDATIYRGQVETDPATISAMRSGATDTRAAGIRSALASQRSAAESNPEIASRLDRRNQELAARKSAVQQNAIARAMQRNQPPQANSGGGFESYLQNVAMNANDPRMAAQAAGMLLESQRARQAEALTRSGWDRDDARQASQNEFAAQQAQLGRLFEGEQTKYSADREAAIRREGFDVQRQANELQAEANRLETQGRKDEADKKRREGAIGMVMDEFNRIKGQAAADGVEITDYDARRQAEQNVYRWFPDLAGGPNPEPESAGSPAPLPSDPYYRRDLEQHNLKMEQNVRNAEQNASSWRWFRENLVPGIRRGSLVDRMLNR